MDDLVSQYLRRHQMAQAYVSITQQMGPSAQLLAFVNYDRVREGDIGLESFDLMEMHDAVLADMLNNDSFAMACESFGGKLASIAERVKNKLTFNKGDSLDAVGKGKLAPKASSLYVMSKNQFDLVHASTKEAFAALDFILGQIPKVHTTEAWEEFYKEHTLQGRAGKLGDHMRAVEKQAKVVQNIGKAGSFENSGWTASNLPAAVAEASEAMGHFLKYKDRIDASCDSMKETLAAVQSSHLQQQWDQSERIDDATSAVDNATKDKDDPSRKHVVGDVLHKGIREAARQQRKQQHDALMRAVPSHVVAAMNQAATLVDEATAHLFRSTKWMYKSLKDASRHFEVTPK